ncbi:uncharacterized protein N0V89_011971 [Didymosphaeria variabile]|uniref:Uncharacterized protein n=1 Tax=Didymosphaeria variabile TaxID=1932322 RepID=A0A9W8XAR6_9PLEO|nr:uncharacterized protein N0V89_011971 [Didymosphaeria variabile]KAJ4345836.1 hypothetical protein N0V89_011971 [Didymosphaeria variabile]
MAPPDADQGENLFHRLPLELKFMVFDLLLVREHQDLIFHAEANDGNLEMLQKVQAWDEAVFEDAATYLIRDGASRFIFYSDREPRRALYQSLRRLPDTFRRRITRVCLPNFTLFSGYWQSLMDYYEQADRTNAVAGMSLLQLVFPRIRQLDIELHLAEFFLRVTDRTKPMKNCHLLPIFRVLECLRNYPKIGDMQIRVRWIRKPGCGVAARGMEWLYNQPQKRGELEEKVLGALRGRIPAKSIEDTPAWE